MSEYEEEDFLQLSGIQHFLFCRRQWALIHIENQWEENFRTVDGEIMHERTHTEGSSEKRGDILITRGMRIFSRRLGVSGQCDTLEFHRDENGVQLNGRQGKWQPFPVEYKRGEPKKGNYDSAQLCLQAMCLEEMLCCKIESGALFYGETKRRTPVEFTEELRMLVENALEEMHDLYKKGRTPKVKPSKSCGACSLSEICLPELAKTENVRKYIAKRRDEL